MKLTRKQLVEMIREERARLNEGYGSPSAYASGDNSLIDFANAWASLGRAVQEQVEDAVGWYNSAREEAPNANPAALKMAAAKLGMFLRMVDDQNAEVILNALNAAYAALVQDPGSAAAPSFEV